MPVIFRRPHPADAAATRLRLTRLTHPLAASGELANPAPAPEPPEPPEPLPTQLASWRTRITPRSLRDARLDPGRQGIVVLAVVAVSAAGFTAVGVLNSRPRPVPLSAPTVAARPAAPSASAAPAVVVAVAGDVRHPGLFTLPIGSRVADAVRAAGGVRPGSSIGLLNLARRLVDGEQVIVGAAAPPAGGAAPAVSGGPLNLNAATIEQLDALPGVGPILAQRILDYRAQHGAFRSIDQLREVGGIGEAKFAELRQLVVV